MNKTSFEWSASVRSVAIFACAIAFTAWILQSPTDAAPPRGYFTNITNVGPLSGVDAHHFNPAVSRNGLTLYFNDSDWGPQLDNYEGSNDIWISQRTSVNEPFGSVIKLAPPVNTDESELLGSISEDGLSLYFSRWFLSANPSYSDLFVATCDSVDEPFSNVNSLGVGVNTEANEFAPHVAPDGLPSCTLFAMAL